MDFHKKKQKKVESGSPEASIHGDAWIFTWVKRHSYLLVGTAIGKRTLETCRRLFDAVVPRLKLPFPSNKLELFSDGHGDYLPVIRDYFANNCVNYGQVIKIREKGKVVDKIKRPIIGNPSLHDIETTDVENLNSIFRERIGRLVRRTKCHSKKRSRLENAIEFFGFHWNFMHRLPKRGTPAMEEDIIDHPWSWDNFLMFRYAV